MIYKFLGSTPSPLFLTAVLHANGWVGQVQVHLHFGIAPSGIPLGWPRLKDERLSAVAILKSKSESDTTKDILKTRRGVGVTAGERNTSSPQQVAG